MNLRFVFLFAAVTSVGLRALGEATPSRFDAGGYFRAATRPDFQGGDGKLGYWNLYGRLLNEGPYAALELKLDLLPPESDGRVWSTLRARVEGGSLQAADAFGGNLARYRLSQLYVQSGNLLAPNLIWQVGTLDSSLGDLGLYDMRLAQVLYETVGASLRYRTRALDVVAGLGDSGWMLRGENYSTAFTAAVLARVRPSERFEFGIGGQLMYEPKVVGNRFAPYASPDVSYDDLARGRVVERYFLDHPQDAPLFPAPSPRENYSGKLVGYLGFGNLGPLMWNSLYANVLRRPADQSRTERFENRDYALYVHDLTDERWQVNVGDEARFTLLPGKLDVAWGALAGFHWDNDNRVQPSDENRRFASTVLRGQAYLTDVLHLLVEGSAAYEESTLGNLYRDHADSIFKSAGGRADDQGLEFGASRVRLTQQFKVGPVLNPAGRGIYTRPSLRLLYGVQHSTQNNAFGNSFVTTLDENSQFQTVERHWHHVLALEAEAWF